MFTDNGLQITVRQAEQADIAALVAIKGPGSEALHRDRLRDAQGPGFRYFVLLANQAVVGFACLVMRRPAYWSDAGDAEHLPQISDLQVKESQRGRGYGSALISAIERHAAATGYRELFLSVEPTDNPRAYALYLRLGYRQVQSEPYLKIWELTDSAGILHRGENWVVDLVKPLSV
jgi:ribosomal protein S18 acetylase RimI-like enzyme